MRSFHFLAGLVRSFAICLLAVAGHVLPVHAQQFATRSFSRYTINNGLSQSMISSITQDKQGFMWFGTKDGLNRFDGYEFSYYHHDPFDSSTLSDNAISAIFCDSDGRLWVGTMNGSLDVYDADKDCFRHLLKENFNKGNIRSITEDHSRHIWVATYGNGIFELRFDKTGLKNLPDKIVHYVNRRADNTTINSNFVLDIFPDSAGKIWVSTTEGFFQYATLNQSVLRFHTPQLPIFSVAKKTIPGGIQFNFSRIKPVRRSDFKSGGGYFTEDAHNRLWIGTPSGLFLLKQRKDTLFYFDPLIRTQLDQANIHAVKNIIHTDFQKKQSSIWMGFIGGLGVMNTDNFSMQFVSNEPGNGESLVPGAILSIYQDRSGCVWLGSNGSGLSKYNARSALFPLPEFHTADGKLRTTDLSVRSFLDAQNDLLIGTTKGLMVADKNSRLMKRIPGGSGEDAPDLIFDIIPDSTAGYWFGANSGLFRFNPENNQLQRFSPNITGNGQTDNRVYKIHDGGHGHLWCLTPYGLSVFNISDESFVNYFYGHKPVNGYSEPTYGDIYQLPDGNFWIGTGDGLMYFDKVTKKFTPFVSQPADTTSLSFNAVRSVVPDPRFPQKYLWVGTAGGGLNRFDLRSKKFTHYTVNNGLPNNVVYGILPDDRGNLWMSTNNGLSRFNPASGTFINYNAQSGLQSNEFNSGAFYKNNRGELFFGGIAGFNAFYPDKIILNHDVPDVVFTGFRMGNQLVTIKGKNSPLEKPVFRTGRIRLPFTDNNISFEIAGLDYSNPEKTQYAYKLEPVDHQWIRMGTNRVIVFSNLNPGNYMLKVRAANGDGAWGEKSTAMALIIAPPWWKTWWALLVFALALLTALFFVRKYELSRVWLKNRLKVEQIESEKLRELDYSKSRFFANISHEFRTPLTLIIGPVEDLLQKKETEGFKTDLSYIRRNAKRLLRLINQLLDLSKLDARSYGITTSREDIVPFVKQIVHSFSSMAHLKNIELETEVDPRLKNKLRGEEITFYFDDDIIEKVLSNLLSNSFKFAKENGHITVVLSLSEIEKDFLELKVEDDGVGIAPDKLPHVFERFYQANDGGTNPFDGSGIGLSLVRELVQLHGGRITAKSCPGELTIFTCLFPLNKKTGVDPQDTSPLHNYPTPVPVEDAETEEPNNVADGSLPVALLIEDQPDVRRYIRGRLMRDYLVLEARDGEEGLAIAREKIPDIVISDVMMPKMDGFELCHSLKTDTLTSHIPVILLTARAADADKFSGLETGADAYIIKPFNTRELLLRVHNLIEVRNRMRAKFSDKLIVKPSEITVTSRDRTFMEEIMHVIEKHLGDERFSVERLGLEVHMSTSQINRKLNALVNQSAQQLIRSVRMQQAEKLLKGNAGSVADVAYRVGFSEPAYFSRVFKRHFGYAPSEVKK